MSGLRWTIALVVVLLWVPVALLVRHALVNVEAEKAARHRSVAERLFDEMERELTGWLRQEEDRPFGHYRFLYLPDGQGLVPERSPLADGPGEPFVFAHFQIDPDGGVSSPLWPLDANRAGDALGWRMEPEQIVQRDQILGVLADLVLHRTAKPVPSQDAGTTVSVDDARRTLDRWRRRAPASEASAELLSRLNRGLSSRSDRTTRVQRSQFYNIAELAGAEPGAGGEGGPLAPLQQVVDLSLEPMVGRSLDATFLMLYRTVVVGDRAYRQGMVIDGEALVAWLSSRVLASEPGPSLASLSRQALPRKTLAPRSLTGQGQEAPAGLAVEWDVVGDARTPEDRAGPQLVFRHRFAEPFSSVAARVRMDPLPSSPTALYIYSLAVLLGLTSTLGLWALYRTVSARLRFAERQNNFVSAVSHELKTPLTAIRMHGEMLRDGVVSSEEKRQGYYRVLTAEAERLSRLIHNVLEVSQLEKKTRRFVMAPGDPRDVLREVAEVLAPHASQLGFEIKLEDDGPADTLFDRDALAQVIFNLVDNALKYARRAADKTIVLSSENAGDEIKLTVADRGPGVPRKQLREVFEPFYRGESEMTRTAKGTGIGLSLVRSLIRPMGGTVRGRNRDEGGFAVEIRLPTQAGLITESGQYSQ